jgi:hypothetical protein
MKKCINCKAEYKGSAIKYCSYKCQQDFQRNEKISLWLSGSHDGMRGKTSTSNWIKGYLIKLHGNKCLSCGWCEVNEFTKNVPIELEHIDGDFTNNKIENLTLLCPNCHSLTSTYKGANKKGRPRSKYYRGS